MKWLTLYEHLLFQKSCTPDALRKELVLIDSKTDVIVIQPGHIKTPIWDKAEQIDLAPYQGSPYYELGQKVQQAAVELGKKGADPQQVADCVLGVLARTHNQTRYIVSDNWPQEVLIPRGMPERLMDRLTKKVLWQ